MTKESLDILLSRAKVQQVDKDFDALNNTLVKLIGAHFHLCSFELERRRTSDWHNKYALLRIKCGGNLFRIPVRKLEKLDRELSNQIGEKVMSTQMSARYEITGVHNDSCDLTIREALEGITYSDYYSVRFILEDGMEFVSTVDREGLIRLLELDGKQIGFTGITNVYKKVNIRQKTQRTSQKVQMKTNYRDFKLNGFKRQVEETTTKFFVVGSETPIYDRMNEVPLTEWEHEWGENEDHLEVIGRESDLVVTKIPTTYDNAEAEELFARIVAAVKLYPRYQYVSFEGADYDMNNVDYSFVSISGTSIEQAYMSGLLHSWVHWIDTDENPCMTVRNIVREKTS